MQASLADIALENGTVRDAMSRGDHIETLIAEVASRRILWDMRDKNYHNRHAVDEEWSQVAKVVDMNSNETKAKWKSLRDSFRRELKKMPQRDVEDHSKSWYSKWAYFESMLFLRDVMKFKEEPKTPRCSDTEENHTNDSDYKDGHANANGDDGQRRLENPVPNDLQHSNRELKSINHSNINFRCKRPLDVSSGNSMYVSSPKKKRRYDKLDILERVLLELESKKKDYHQYLNDEKDDDLNFFKSLLPYIRKLPPLKKLQIRSQYQSILINEIDEMENKKKTANEFSNFTYPSSSSSSQSSSTTVSAENSEAEQEEHVDGIEDEEKNIKIEVDSPEIL